MAAPDAPQPRLRQTLDTGNRGTPGRTHFSSQLLCSWNRSRVVRDRQPLGQVAVLRAAGLRLEALVIKQQEWRLGLGVLGSKWAQTPRHLRIGRNVRDAWRSRRTECPGWRSGSLQSRRSVGRTVVDRMSLAGWHVHLLGSACPAATCAIESAEVGHLKSQLTLCKLVSAPPGRGA